MIPNALIVPQDMNYQKIIQNANYLTAKKSKKDAINVKKDILSIKMEKLALNQMKKKK